MSSVTHDQRPAESDHRWLILVIVAIAQLMVVLDATVVNIALPSAQRALGFPNSDRQWVVTAYALAFGSLLLVGGRLGDMFSRKRVFITGAGLAGLDVANATRQRLLTRIFGALDEADRATLLRLLDQLDGAAQQLTHATVASHLGE